MNRKFLLKLHLWLSLPLGIIIMLICLSGATLVFKNEIRNALGMPKVVAPHGKSGRGGKDGKTASLQQEKSTASHQCSPNGCSQCPSKEVCHPSASAKDDASAKSNEAVKEKTSVVGKSSSKDAPYGTTTKRDFFSYVTKFHTGLLMGSVGKLIVTYTTLFFVFILLSGIFIFLPSNGKQLRQRFKVEWGKGAKRRLFDLHVSLGWWTLLWLLLLAVTGLGFGLKLVPKGTEMMQLFHELHIGSWGGMLTKIITFVVSLIGASLPVTGYLLYFRRKRK
ncbi:PepSY-associated TM helix domain-containing protein [uncultured Prevotella sp.]|uniref:PepSY-associated TM helix domain-containing protein n=1 Tax=uncultured Prevotella sp. TaxID=159272 RepID=UPI002610CDD3|nr:PepSY-associated TM helix domain-containing protein [uncultured Prevotella sp.]